MTPVYLKAKEQIGKWILNKIWDEINRFEEERKAAEIKLEIYSEAKSPVYIIRVHLFWVEAPGLLWRNLNGCRVNNEATF